VTAARALARTTALRAVVVGVGGWLPVALVVLAIPWLLRRDVTPGTVLGILTYLTYGLQPALRTLVNGVGGNGVVLTATLGRLIEATGDPLAGDPRPRGSVAGAAQAATPGPDGWRWPVGYGLELRGLTFRYGPASEPVVRDLDLFVPEGDHLVVVGPSGAGKSTLARLVAGLLAPGAGQVLIGGAQPRDLPAAELARLRVLVPQEAYVFAGTLRENLCYLRPEATDRDLDYAVAQLGLAPLVSRLGGYEAGLAPQSLSAGERQLVAAARTYLAAAPVVLLDEATCHLDPGAEAQVERAFANRPGTLVVIAHRLSSALRARHVLVLDGSRAWYGTHADLLRSSPVYRDLVGYWQSAAPAPTVTFRPDRSSTDYNRYMGAGPPYTEPSALSSSTP
jgi:ATP-binding cassette, subfamily B, bacterial RamB/AmfA